MDCHYMPSTMVWQVLHTMAEMLKSNMKTFIGNSKIFRVLKVHDNDNSLLSLYMLPKISQDT
jgi:hypothetical protein